MARKENGDLVFADSLASPLYPSDQVFTDQNFGCVMWQERQDDAPDRGRLKDALKKGLYRADR